MTIPTTFAYFSGPQDWLVTAVIVLVLIGGSKIPYLAKGLGDEIRDARRPIAIRVSGMDKYVVATVGVMLLALIGGLLLLLFAR